MRAGPLGKGKGTNVFMRVANVGLEVLGQLSGGGLDLCFGHDNRSDPAIQRLGIIPNRSLALCGDPGEHRLHDRNRLFV